MGRIGEGGDSTGFFRDCRDRDTASASLPLNREKQQRTLCEQLTNGVCVPEPIEAATNNSGRGDGSSQSTRGDPIHPGNPTSTA